MDEILNRIGTITCCAVAVITKGETILRGFRQYNPEIGVWTGPGGRCEEGETLEQGLRRETEEETGINDLKIVDYIGAVPGLTSGDTLHIFYCETDQEPKNMEPEKFLEWKWMPINEYLAIDYKNDSAFTLVNKYLNTAK